MKTQTLISRITWPKTMAGLLRTACAARLPASLLLLALPAVVEAQFNYTADNGAITITGYTGPGGSVTIPSTIDGLPVTSIGDNAFFGCSLTGVTIPNSVTNIGSNVFGCCDTLKAIAVDPANSSYSSVDGVLFDRNQTTLVAYPEGRAGGYVIPNSVTSIGDLAFDNCSSLSSVAIPNSVMNIGTYAFRGCTSLTSVTIPNSVTSIGGSAFWHCTSLTSVRIGSGVTSIGYWAFGYCTSLTAITVDVLDSFYSSVAGVLFDKTRTTLIQCPGGKGGSYTVPDSVTSIGDGAFSGCSSLTNVTIPDSVISIGRGAFYGASLITATIPDSVTSMGDGAFLESGLTTVTIGKGVTTIGDDTFEACTGLTVVTIPNSVTSIGDHAFENCTSLTNVTIPDSVTNIGDNVFEECMSLTNVTIGSSVTSIGASAFAFCYDSLTSVYFRGNAPSADSSVFAGDRDATVYYLARTTGWGPTFAGLPTALWDAGFFGALRVSISPPSVVSAGAQWQVDGGAWQNGGAIVSYLSVGSHTVAFSTVPGWITPTNQSVTITLNQTTAAAGTYVSVVSGFNYTTNNGAITITGYTGSGGAVTIPSTINGLPVASIGDGAFDSCSNLSSVTIGNGVTSIGHKAFAYCPSLISVYFLGNAPNADTSVFAGDNNATVYYLPGTTGWGATLGGLPTMVLPPIILTPPSTQTAEMGSVAFFSVEVTNTLPAADHYQWFFGGSNALSGATNSYLDLANVQLSQAGAYTLVVTNLYGAVTGAPALLSVIAAVERRLVPALNLTADVGSFLHLDYADAFGPGAQWLSLSNFTLASAPQLCFDLSEPLPAQRFYRAWQTNVPSARPVLDQRLATEIPLTGAVGNSVRINYINQLGPTNAWVTLDTVTVTNSPQLYFDVSMFRQPTRLYRLVAVP